MKLLIIENTEPEDTDFNTPLISNLANFTPAEVVNYRQTPPVDILRTYDGIVLSGTPVHYPYDIIATRPASMQWINDIDVPILGICFGHQTIGRLFGAEIIEDKEAEDGLEPIVLHAKNELFNGIAAGDLVAAHHRGAITLPKGFTLLASTAACHNHAMKHTTREIYSVQFHTELSDAGIKVLKNFVAIARQRAALKATAQPVSSLYPQSQ